MTIGQIILKCLIRSVSTEAVLRPVPPAFARLLRRRPVPGLQGAARNRAGPWNDVTKFWALLKYEDIRFVSTHPDKFSSTKGITIPDPAMPNPVQEGNLIFTDPPRHRQLRKLISSGFTPRQVAILEPKVREIVHGILEDVEPGSTHEFAESSPPLCRPG